MGETNQPGRDSEQSSEAEETLHWHDWLTWNNGCTKTDFSCDWSLGGKAHCFDYLSGKSWSHLGLSHHKEKFSSSKGNAPREAQSAGFSKPLPTIWCNELTLTCDYWRMFWNGVDYLIASQFTLRQHLCLEKGKDAEHVCNAISIMNTCGLLWEHKPQTRQSGEELQHKATSYGECMHTTCIS